MREVVQVCSGSRLGRLKPDTAGLSHSGYDLSTFPLNSNIPSLGVKAQSDTHYSLIYFMCCMIVQEIPSKGKV